MVRDHMSCYPLNLVFHFISMYSGASTIVIFLITRMNALHAHKYFRCNWALSGSPSCCAGHEDTWLHKRGPHLHQQQIARQQLTRVWIFATLQHVEMSNYLKHCHWSRAIEWLYLTFLSDEVTKFERYQVRHVGITIPGLVWLCSAREVILILYWRILCGGVHRYPGGIFDPLGFSKGNVAEYQLKELKNGRWDSQGTPEPSPVCCDCAHCPQVSLSLVNLRSEQCMSQACDDGICGLRGATHHHRDYPTEESGRSPFRAFSNISLLTLWN